MYSDILLYLRGARGILFLFTPRCRLQTTPPRQVLYTNHDLGNPGNTDVLDGGNGVRSDLDREDRQRKAFLRELEAMVRLRSPHTVNVFGAITSLPNRLVLVMELLSKGDLRTLLKNSERPLPEEQCRRIIGDVCAGMAFLHRKKTVHGDLKSANVLLDGAGRAKVRGKGCGMTPYHPRYNPGRRLGASRALLFTRGRALERLLGRRLAFPLNDVFDDLVAPGRCIFWGSAVLCTMCFSACRLSLAFAG